MINSPNIRTVTIKISNHFKGLKDLDGCKHKKTILDGYFENGGQHVNLNVMDLNDVYES